MRPLESNIVAVPRTAFRVVVISSTRDHAPFMSGGKLKLTFVTSVRQPMPCAQNFPDSVPESVRLMGSNTNARLAWNGPEMDRPNAEPFNCPAPLALIVVA